MSPDAYQLCRALFAALAQDRPDLANRVAPLLEILAPRRHGPGFSSVVWDGARYSFTSAQAAVVELLWEASQYDCPEVRTERLMEAAGSAGRRLDNVFRTNGVANPAWGVMIVPGEAKGTFQLAPVAQKT